MTSNSQTTHSATTRITAAGAPRSGVAGRARRVRSLGRAEALLLMRNPIGLFIALALPASFAVMVVNGQPNGDAGSGRGAAIVVSLTAFALLSNVYYNLVTALVARREELVLKRLRTGETDDAEIIAGTSLPSVAIAWGQTLVGLAAAVAWFDLAWPANPLLILAAVVLGTIVLIPIAAVSTAITRTVEMAQVTAMPVIIISMVPGLMLPLAELPGAARRVAAFLPMTRMVELLHLGLTGTTTRGTTVGTAASFGAAVVPLLVLGAWVVVGVMATRRWFRWEPRH